MSSVVARPLLRQSISRMALRRFESTTTAKAADATKEAASKAAEATKNNASKAADATKEAAAKATEATRSTAAKATEATKEAASQAASTASQMSSKAGEGLSKVSSSASSAASSAASAVQSTASKAQGRIGGIIAFVEKQTPQVIYWSRVGFEMSRLVFQGQKMSPPSVSTIQSYGQQAWKAVQNPSSLLQSANQAASQAASAASKATQQPANMMEQARNINTSQLVFGGVVLAEVLGFFTVGEMLGRMKIIGYHGHGPAEHH